MLFDLIRLVPTFKVFSESTNVQMKYCSAVQNNIVTDGFIHNFYLHSYFCRKNMFSALFVNLGWENNFKIRFVKFSKKKKCLFMTQFLLNLTKSLCYFTGFLTYVLFKNILSDSVSLFCFTYWVFVVYVWLSVMKYSIRKFHSGL